MKVLIIGAGPQALYVLRCLSRAGHEAYVVSFDEKVASFSKYGQKYLAVGRADFINYLEEKKEIIDKAFICGGKELQFILDEFPSIFNSYDVYPKPIEAIKVFADKNRTYEFLRGFGAIAPKSYEVANLLAQDSLLNPLIVKWNQELPPEYKATFKTKVFQELVDLKIFLANLDYEIHQYIIIQDFISGQESNNISLQVAFDESGLQGSLLAQKLRVSKSGFTSYIEEIDMSCKFTKQALTPFVDGLIELNYSGLAEAEYKVCDITGDYFLIEVNPRPCGLVSALNGKYSNVNTFFEGKSLVENNTNHKVRWSSIGRDLQTCMMHFKQGNSFKLFFEEIYSIFTANTYDVFSLTDIKPFFSQFKVKNK
jgi:predicted ATP-grasp superfamily ATP-dependent carboligase